MELITLVIFVFIVYETIKLIFPFHPFSSNSAFMTGFWTYIWSTPTFRRVVKLIILIIILLLMLILLI